MRFQIFVLLFLIITLKSDLIDAEYVSIDDPKCTSGCSALSDINARTICYQDQLNFYNYKLVKSIFNFGKASIYAGLWINRYVRIDFCFQKFCFIEFFSFFKGQARFNFISINF